MLVGIHASLAAILGVQELELDRSEGRAMADAAKEVLKYYPVGLNPKSLAWINLTVVCSGIYGTRFMAWRNRMAMEVEQHAAAPPTPIRQQPVNAAPRPNPLPNPSDVWPQTAEVHAAE